MLNGQSVTREEWLAGAPGITPGHPPAILTDSVFLAGMESQQAKEFNRNPEIGQFYLDVAKEEGQDTTGKVYLSSLAEYPGDPRAWVSGRSDVQKVCEERGWGCKGAVTVKGEKAEPKNIDVAPDLVDERVLDNVEANPDLLKKTVGELRHEAKQQLLPKRKVMVD